MKTEQETSKKFEVIHGRNTEPVSYTHLEYRELISRYSIIIIYVLCCIFYLVMFKPMKKYSEMSLLLPKAVIYIISLIAVVMLIVTAFLIYKFQFIQTGNSIALFICIEMTNMGITLLGINLKRYQG